MIEFYLISAVVLFAAGAVAGFVALVSLGIHREERLYSMTMDAPGRIARGARVANGLHSSMAGDPD